MLIIASVGHNITEEQIIKMILTGADVLRFNLSHRSIDNYIESVQKAEKVIDSLNASVKKFIDFPLNKHRLGFFEGQTFPVQEGSELILRSADYSPDCLEFIPLNIPHIGSKVSLGQIIAIGDGEVTVQIKDIISSDIVKIQIINSGIIRNSKTVNLGNNYAIYDEDYMVEIYKKTLEQINGLHPDYLACSYISKSFIEKIKLLFPPKTNRLKYIIKIEKNITAEELNAICQDNFFDMILIDRGEMGVNMPFEKIGLLQKQIMSRAKKFSKPILISTHILASTIHNYIPTRADICDLTNIVLDGAAGIIFGYETGLNKRAAYTIATAKKIINEVEKYQAKLANHLTVTN
ncbi:MAG: hypothetical protein A3J93_02935 [Candidatus Magasanikbacteria bacterium RIFOXYC2_FULL_42_28]|uniref:Pyruvate kinase n=1 Tax=Candidatus Magasanikbacteria bacterium RIFOXYC2_FULL_42_28 TaxID=1798704 RepID=A0A1F6NUR6_9BACT|nr:MAG: hypothetical protein A3J93_02935 [Candidatus Magasanikbacteria bacterium RIFOXYC2_FULL_42_28]